MLRVLLFGAAVLVVFVGITKVIPILDEGENLPQAHVSAAAEARVSEQDTPVSQLRAVPKEELFNEVFPSCIISTNPISAFAGYPVSIAWGSTNALSATLSSVGPVPVTGGMYVSAEKSTTYTLTIRSATGEVASCSTDLKVY